MEDEKSKQRGEESIEETVVERVFTIRCLSAVPADVEALLAEIAAAERELASE